MSIEQVYRVGMAPLELYQDLILGAVAQSIAAAAKTLKTVTVDNEANAHLVYFKAWDSNAPTVGTTAPYLCLPVAAGVKKTFILGFGFPAGLAVACVKHVSTTDGPGTSGTTSPTNAVPTNIVTN